MLLNSIIFGPTKIQNKEITFAYTEQQKYGVVPNLPTNMNQYCGISDAFSLGCKSLKYIFRQYI